MGSAFVITGGGGGGCTAGAGSGGGPGGVISPRAFRVSSKRGLSPFVTAGGNKPTMVGLVASSTNPILSGMASGSVSMFESVRVDFWAWRWAENTFTGFGVSILGANNEGSIGGIVIACIWISGINTSTLIVTTWTIADTTTVSGLQPLCRDLDSKSECSSTFDLLWTPRGEPNLPAANVIDTSGRKIVPR